MFKISGDAVCQTSLEIGPNKFIGVKLRRVSWEVKGMDSRMAPKELFNEFGSVEGTSVPKEDEISPEVSVKRGEESPDLSRPDIPVVVKACVETEPPSLGRDRNGGDGRDLRPASGDNKGWRFSSERPGSLDVGNKRESALIQEDQAGSKPIGLFLYEARCDVSSSESPPPGVPWPSSAASGSSNPDRSSSSRGFRCNSVLGNACERFDRYASRSKDRSNNPLRGDLSPRYAPRFSFACPTKGVAVPYSVSASALSDLSSDRLDTSAPRSLKKNPVLGPPSDRYGPVSTSGWPEAVASGAFGGCHEVSLCPPG